MTPNVPNTSQGALSRFPRALAPLSTDPQESIPATSDSVDKKRSRRADESGHTRKKIAGELMVEYVPVLSWADLSCCSSQLFFAENVRVASRLICLGPFPALASVAANVLS